MIKKPVYFFLIWTLSALVIAGCSAVSNPFVTVQDGHFVRDGKPYTYVGTNFWYGPILASDGRGGDIERLRHELDAMKGIGIENLRVLVGGDGADGVYSRVEPTLQTSPGVYNDTLLVGLDRFLVELGERGMQAVLYINNSWEWSGGYGQYLEWATGEKTLIPLVDGYGPFMQQMQKFQTCTEAQQLYFDHLRNIVSRVNSITGKPYRDDPAIFSWQLGNEPRCFSDDPDVRAGFIGWMTEAARIVREIDPNHLVSTGNEGLMGCEGDASLLRAVNEIPGIDYMTIHIWPYNWSWVRPDSLTEDIDIALQRTGEYIRAHRKLADELGMPLVAEEFGFPRDGFRFGVSNPTTARDRYYGYVFSQVGESLDGANFWGWSGFAVTPHEIWQSGDPYTGDPSQEPQGLNGVYVTDSTVGIIAAANGKGCGREPMTLVPGKILYGHQDDLVYGHSWCVSDISGDPLERSDVKDVTGHYPAMVGFDLGGIELGEANNLDGVPFELMRRAAIAHSERGGVVTFSWHPRNPLTGGDAWDVSSDEVVWSILPGGDLHPEFMLWLKRAADFIESLGGIPVIFRPWHENSGSWFWWGWKLCSASEYKTLYRMTWTYFTLERGLDNVQWCYSPNGPFSEADFLARYPGDDCIDFLGGDLYEFAGPDGLASSGRRFSSQLKDMLAVLKKIAQEHGKSFCLSETGLEGLSDPQWWTGVLYPAIKDSGISYVLTWRNAHDQPGHFFAPWKGFENSEDFKLFAEKEDIVML
ncbi:MAG: beta-mannosidase [Bacteroidales bacterium]|nr:beta-mannosidase [Bacteroidales bacterium]